MAKKQTSEKTTENTIEKTAEKTTGKKGMRLYPPPEKDFDPFAASKTHLMRHGLPLRPDPQTQPEMAALWERKAARYRSFDHLEPRLDPKTATRKPVALPAIGPDPIASCGYQFFSPSAPFTALFVTWTVPNLQFSPSPFGINRFHTFAGLGFLDVHVEMTVDSAQNVTSQLAALGVGNVNMPVHPGDVISASLCLDTKPPGTAHYFFTNETTLQTINFSFDTGFPPAVTINAGVTREFSHPSHPLAQFGIVYFDEVSAYATDGFHSLTAGEAITMVNTNGKILARPFRINDFTFKAVFESGA